MERKYFEYPCHITYYEKEASFFTSRDYRYLSFFYFYEENSKFYEFFTGRYLGSKADIIDKQYGIFDKEFLPVKKTTFYIVFKGIRSDPVARCITAESFAEEVKKLVKDKEFIISALENFFKEKHQEWVKKKEEEQKAKEEKRIRDKENISWLNDILDSRNN